MPIQANRDVSITTPLGPDVLLFHRLQMNEALGRLYSAELELLSEDEQVKIDDILGQLISVTLTLENGGERYFTGYVSDFSQVGRAEHMVRYQATLQPWMWFLSRTSDCRIFQQKTAPQIIEDVFRDCGFTDFENALSQEYRTWDYCVQYRESDFNFVSRLMEQEGIYYFFRHEQDKHMLVLADSPSAHSAFPGYGTIPYFPPDNQRRRDQDHIDGWLLSKSVQTGLVVLEDYDFTRPKANLQTQSKVTRKHANADYEVFDYPGEYQVFGDGEQYARRRIEEMQVGYERVQGQGDARGLAAGHVFSLEDYPREDQHREYLITSARYEIVSDEYYATPGGADEDLFRCHFHAIDYRTPFRALRNTPRPIVQGPQTAIVVGPAGEEIWTDKHGRVKVQFHWDRYGKADENSSCWVRVSQVWAGKKWGAMHIPRIGQEVIVEFLEGDPDRPIITGRVYNGDNMPVYDLPANQTQSGIKSRSTKNGTPENFNEIRFEDKKGQEQLYIHAEKNQDIVVENDETHWVGHDRTKTIDNDETTTVGRDRTESVGRNETISIANNRTEDVGKNETISIAENRTEDVGKSETVAIGKDRSHDIGNDDALNVGKNLVINAGDSVLIKTGSASISMKKNGDITISGKTITIKGSGNVIIKGKKILQN